MSVNVWWPRFNKTRKVSIEAAPVLDRSTKFFTMGSCFANEIRAALMRENLTVLPRPQPAILPLFSPLSHEETAWGAWDERVHLQFYNTFSIKQEFEKAFGHWEQAEDDYWSLTFPDGQVAFQDPYRRGIFAGTPDNLRKITVALDQALKSAIFDADVIVLTLGLTEVWRLKRNMMVMCNEPGYRNGGGAGISSFHASTYEENLANMRRVMDLLFAAFPDKRVYVTTSPVALGRTFRDVDIAVANMESKSILRTVAGALATAYPNVTYFPSYEMCMYNPEATFTEDGRHVRRERVEEIVKLFKKSFFVPADAAPLDPSSRLGLLAREAPVVDMLRAMLRAPAADAQAVLDGFVDAYDEMTKGGEFSEFGYLAMRQIYAATKGQLDTVIDAKISEIFPPPAAEDSVSPMLGRISATEIQEVARTLDRDGIYLFDRPMLEEPLGLLRELVEKTPMRDQFGGDWTSLAAEDKNRARYMCDEHALYRGAATWQAVADPALLGIVGQYLRCQPVLDSVYAYATFPGPRDEEELSRSAQLFHADKDRVSFIKFFLYLTDVDEETGPHVYVAGSHRSKPDHLWRDGRFRDEEVLPAYPPEAVRRLTGPAGTMFLADTRGIHKGIPVERGRRIVFQIEYSNSCAGKQYPMPFRREDNPAVRELGERNPRLVMRFE